jgi:hypothetical protein
MSTKTFKRRDTFPYFEQTLGHRLNNATVWFRLEEPDGEYLTVNSEAQIINPIRGDVRYRWEDGDLHKEGTYKGEFLIEWDDGRKRHVPSGDVFYRIEVGEPITGELDPEQWANQPIDVSIATVDELRGYDDEPVKLGSDIDADGHSIRNVGDLDVETLEVGGTEIYFGDDEPEDADDGAIWIGKD